MLQQENAQHIQPSQDICSEAESKGIQALGVLPRRCPSTADSLWCLEISRIRSWTQSASEINARHTHPLIERNVSEASLLERSPCVQTLEALPAPASYIKPSAVPPNIFSPPTLQITSQPAMHNLQGFSTKKDIQWNSSVLVAKETWTNQPATLSNK